MKSFFFSFFFFPFFCLAQEAASLLEGLPGSDPATQSKVLRGIAAKGESAIYSICRAVSPGPDQKPQYAIEGLAFELSKPNAEKAQRLALENAILKVLADTPEASKPFFFKQLGRAGSPRSYGALAPALTNPELADSAARALVNIGRRFDVAKAAQPLRKALAANLADGPERSVIYALGDLNDREAATAIGALAAAADSANRDHALRVLAQLGAPESLSLMQKAVKTASAKTLFRESAWALGYAEALAANGDKKAALVLCDEVKKAQGGPEFGHVQCNALSTAFKISGDASPLITALGHENAYVRARAADLLGSAADDKVADMVSAQLRQADSAAKPELLSVLGKLGKEKSLGDVLNCVNDSEEAVRSAAVQATAGIGGPKAVEGLVQTIAARTDATRDAAIDWLAVMNDAATPGALVAAVEASESADSKAALLQALEKTGSAEQLPVFMSAMSDADANVRKVAAGAIKTHAEASQVPALFGLMKKLGDASDQRRIQSAIVSAAKTKSTPEEQAAALSPLLDGATGQDRIAALTMLSAVQAAPSLGLIAEEAAGKDGETAAAAVRLLAKWQTADAIPALLDAAKKEGPSQALALQSAVRLSDKQSLNDKHATLDQVEKLASDSATRMKVRLARGESDLTALQGWVPLMGAGDLSQWRGATDKVKWEGDAFTYAPGAGHFHTKKKYGDFVLSFEFKVPPGGNNGIGIRAAEKGDPAYHGMEIQVLDNTAEKYKGLKDYQYHGSIYGVAPARRGFLKPVGEWNQQYILAIGDHIKIVLNGEVITETWLKDIEKTVDGKSHPGLLNPEGDIVICGHGDPVSFRNIKIIDYSQPESFTGSKNNKPPKGFRALFNGKNLQGWKGLVANPPKRNAMSPEKLAPEQQKANDRMKKHWVVKNGEIVFDGKGQNLCTEQMFGDFDLYVDWKIEPKGDSGLYLRGTPQVQIWDTENPAQFKHGNQKGSGGLWNNRKHPRDPLVKADNPVGEWNTFFIRMVGQRPTIYLNGKKVTDTVLENYWEREKPIYPQESIELQNHGNTLYFRNIFLRELPR